ncbi:MAG: YihY/virulence factor BrkB family protein [Flavobacteriales bacterium]|nr:YihY/virulence factor BrkB family protein [Flavobacteriales bacterium]
MKKYLDKLSKIWSDNDIFNYSASIAFYTIFSLPSILFLLINLAGLVLDKEAIRNEIIDKSQKIIDYSSSLQIETFMDHISYENSSIFMKIFSLLVLIIGATTVVISLQDALNKIFGGWKQQEPGSIIKKLLLNRVLSLAIILSMVFVVIVSLFLESLINLVIDRDIWINLNYASLALNHLLAIFTILIFFTLIYKWLPNVKIQWSTAWKSATLSTLLFYIGRFLISYYLNHSTILSVYGAAASFIIVPIWIYYSSFIFLIGAVMGRAIWFSPKQEVMETVPQNV